MTVVFEYRRVIVMMRRARKIAFRVLFIPLSARAHQHEGSCREKMADQIVQPNNTIYINNLNEKISIEGAF